MIDVYFNWRGRYISLKMFFPEVRMPTKKDINDQIEKAYPGVVTHSISKVVSGEPFLQIEDMSGMSQIRWIREVQRVQV